MTRIFIKQTLELELVITDKDTLHHLTKVLRSRVNDKIAVVNQNCKIYQISEIQKNEIRLKFLADENINRELTPQIDIAQALLKKDNFELVLQKACELGASNVIALKTKNCVVTLDAAKIDKKLVRYNDILRNAAMQSQRLVIPTINDYLGLEQIDYSQYDLVICCYEAEKQLQMGNLELKKFQKILIIIGPEGGFDQTEIEYLEKQDVIAVSLGARILRAETAAITALSYVMLENEKN